MGGDPIATSQERFLRVTGAESIGQSSINDLVHGKCGALLGRVLQTEGQGRVLSFRVGDRAAPSVAKRRRLQAGASRAGEALSSRVAYVFLDRDYPNQPPRDSCWCQKCSKSVEIPSGAPHRRGKVRIP